MTSVFLFCTADIPAKTINNFLTTITTAFDNLPIFTLICTPDQEHIDEWGTTPPIAPFTTGFKSTSDRDLRSYTRTRIEELKKTNSEGQLSPNWIAILDERSIHDSTVILQHCLAKSSWAIALQDAEVEYHVPGEADVDETEIWWKWRVKFTDAFQLFMSVDGGHGDCRVMSWYTRPEGYVDGVYDVNIARRIINGEIPE
ncbi:hypothetical protein ASPWEDRAFT_181017 [Aspergillus wentii DTO 134E9]|uniref:Uncharacterized protein n=1 Tax=Aspergillus wentii DTO 134E9 TaxID=1073089 RepID=A0A1L9RXG0_ASPWE|nr:uncharacterized protein ASPWEDRAFT_181017 [Aspergillus wentii DTO 134E9]OJJ39641.1 hypothetical protein ASPWEDRAFT_181017 [Aspergillus wentii DTO 134E9]